MHSTLQHDMHEGLLTIRVFGEFPTMDEAVRSMSEMGSLIRKLDPKKILLDMRGVTKPLGYFETFFLMRRSDFLPPHPVCALLDNPRKYATFFKNAASNMGRFYRLFHDPDEAQEWLEKPA